MPVTPEHIDGERWRVRLGAGKDPITGRYKQKSRYFTAKNQREANRKALAVAADLQKEIDAEKVQAGTVGEAAKGLLRSLEADRKSANTIHGYRNIVNLIVRDLGHIPVEKLTVRDVEAWYSKLRSENISQAAHKGEVKYRTESRVHQYHRVLNHVLRTVERHTGIPAVTRRVVPPKRPKPNPRPPESTVLAQLIRSAPEPLRLAAELAAFLGLRRGEVLGLRWKDWDPQAGVLRIRRSVHDADGSLGFKEPKTQESIRDIRVPDKLAAALLAHLARFQAEAPFPERISPEACIFPDWRADPTGRLPWRPMALTGAWRRHCAQQGVEGVRFHDLRHWAASVALQRGVPLHQVQTMLGHSLPSTTLNIYARSIGRGEDASAVLVEELELE